MQRFDVRDSVFKWPKEILSERIQIMDWTAPTGECYASRAARRVVTDVAGFQPVNMKILGLFLMLAGWTIVLAALGMLSTEGARNVFVAAGIGVEVTGLVLVIRSHPAPRGLVD